MVGEYLPVVVELQFVRVQRIEEGGVCGSSDRNWSVTVFEYDPILSKRVDIWSFYALRAVSAYMI